MNPAPSTTPTTPPTTPGLTWVGFAMGVALLVFAWRTMADPRGPRG